MTGKAIALLSGGLDSAVAAAIAAKENWNIYALTVSYGQRHSREVESAKLIANWLRAVRHEIVDLPIIGLLQSSLTTPEADLKSDEKEIGTRIPDTYVPARNTLLISLALAWAESIGAGRIVIGANSIDYSGYPDCRPEFFEAYQTLMNLATKCGVEGESIEIYAPLLKMSKADIVRKAEELRLPFEQTWSCYAGGDRPCDECESCMIRKRGFEEAGLKDPLRE